MMTKADLAIACALLVLAAAGLIVSLWPAEVGARACVTGPAGRAEYALSEDGAHAVAGRGGALTLTIAGGTARVTASDCPDGLCVASGAISRKGQSVACLPLGVLIEIRGGEAAEYDAISK